MSAKNSRTSLSSDSTFTIKGSPTDVTSGGGVLAGGAFAGDLGASRITAQARALLSKVADRAVADATAGLISTIEAVIYALRSGGPEIEMLPPVRASLEEDGSVSLEWTTRDFRLGFGIEVDPKASTWYLVTSKRLGETGMQGFMSAVNRQDLVSLVIDFVRANT